MAQFITTMTRKTLYTAVLVIALVTLSTSVSAKSRRAGNLRTEWGLTAGLSYPIAHFDMGNSTASLSPKLGFSVGAHMALRIGGVFAIQPEINFMHSKIAISDPTQNFSSTIRCNTLQMPILFSFKWSKLRFHLGPIVTILDDPWYADRAGEKVMFGRLYPTVSYAVGMSVCLWQRLLIDARFSSRFNTTTNFLSYDTVSPGIDIKSTVHHLQLKVGVLF